MVNPAVATTLAISLLSRIIVTALSLETVHSLTLQPTAFRRRTVRSLSGSSGDNSGDSENIMASSGTKIQRLVLVGGGHGHVQVIKALNRVSRPKNMHVTLIDTQASASYSGMVPGCVSKLYTPEQTLIHLRPLARWAGIDFVHDKVIDVDPVDRKIYLEEGEECIPYDAVSFDIGSTSRALTETPGALAYTIPTRPISDLVRRIEDAETDLKGKLDRGEWARDAHVVVIGGGAAGIELSLAMRARWSPLFEGSGGQSLSVTLLDSGDELLPAETTSCKVALVKVLAERNIVVRHGSTVHSVTADEVCLEDGHKIPYTYCLWATGASAHALADNLRNHGLAVSDRGWIRVGPTLQSINYPEVFAAGDCATIENLPEGKPSPPKAGVYAVRAGPVLIENLTAFLASEKRSEELVQYVPQDDFLKLLMCGDGKALGFRFGLPLEGKWVWELKDHIDVMFMALFHENNLPALGKGKKELDTSQYDASSERRERLEPEEAAKLLMRTDDSVDYKLAWNALRDMMQDESYKDAVLKITSKF